ncbi:GntR family transcriptional regulator [Clavibacter sp. B3I6]|uniref:GntR family transcriptional regulator n=1 Tax=Clavibacter sp. B3I6 TaxID=3042268 RepID=UPI0027D90C29|nr:GntR family transcriptional regulator [Clavibacter sp. B3I6]
MYEELLARLFDNTLPPGAPMNMDALARDLKVSQTPIREALVRLETTGLVTRAALRGYRAAPMLSAKELDDLMHARCVIEPALAHLAAEHITPRFLDDLDASIESLSTSPTGPSFAEYHDYWKSDERFHDLIARQADNAFLYRAFESLGGQAQRFRMFGRLGVSDADQAIREHKRIREALTTGNSLSAENAMLEHVSAVRARSSTSTTQ